MTARLGRLALGLWLFGTGEGLVVHSDLGNSPWSVFAEGVSLQTPLSIGTATVVTSFALLLCWLALPVRPGFGTVANALTIGLFIDLTLEVLGGRSDQLLLQSVEVLGGIALVGLGSGLYLGAALGPGPRDGLMTGLHARSGAPIAVVRAGIELTALTVGAVLGGTVGVSTVAFALLIGPAVQAGLVLMPPAASNSMNASSSSAPRRRRSA